MMSRIAYLPLFSVDVAILETLQDGPKLQAKIISNLLEQSGESYIYSRVRTLARRGYLTKDKQNPRGVRLSLTEKGRAALAEPHMEGLLYAE